MLIFVLCILSTYFADSLTLLVGATAVLPATIYLITIVSYALARKKVSFRQDNFNLGRFAKPVFFIAILWLVLEIGILTIPEQFHNVTIVSVLMIGLGIVLYLLFFHKKMKKSDRL